MALDYRKCAQEILDHIGGSENITSAAHCATRLRLVIADNSKVDKAALEEVDGVKGMFESNGQLQLIIGTGTVNKVYDEFLAITGRTEESKADVKAAAVAHAPLWRRAIKTLGDVFVPILPAIVASGLLMGVVEALGKAIPGFSQSDWYGFLDMIANTALAYLPIIVAVSAARVFGGNLFLGAVIGIVMIHSSLLNGWNVGSPEDINSFFGVTDGVIPIWKLFGNIKIFGYTLFSVRRSGYQGHVIPVIIAVFLMSRIEKWFHKHIPEMLDLFVTPLCTVLITALLTFIFIGPIFAQLESWVLTGAEWMVKNPIGAAAMGALYPWTVVMGLHHMYNIIEAGMLSSVGLNTWMPIASAANFAQFGACLAVGLKATNHKTKAVAVPSSLSAALGITEPAIFGVNMRFFKPFICAMVGGIIGSLFGAVTNIGATAYGVTGLPGYLTINNPLVYTIELAVSGGIAFALTWTLWKEENPQPKGKTVVEDTNPADFKLDPKVIMTANGNEIHQPVEGKIISREQIPDETFASGVLGDGIAVEPTAETVYAPFDGTISTVAESRHAIGITGKDGMELLIHVGVDTVAMNGDGFEPFVREGDEVKAGQKMLSFSKEKIAAAGHPDCVVVLLTNAEDFDDFKVNA